MSESFYLITGAAGFIGNQFVRFHTSQNRRIVLVDHLPFFRTRSHLEIPSDSLLVDREELPQWLEKNHPNVQAILHLGAITDTRETNLLLLNKFNLEYSQFLWNAASQHRIPFLYASSAATYGAGEMGYEDEEALLPELKPLNPYGDSKHRFDLWALEQEKRGNSPPQWCGFKFFNVFGPGENHKGFMSSVVLHAFEQIQKNGKVTLFKSHREGIPDGHQRRDFIAVEDVISVVDFCHRNRVQRGIYNLGSGKARTFLDLARGVFHSLNLPEKIEWIDTPENIRETYQYFTEAKMDRIRALGYQRPFLSLEEGIRRALQSLTSAQ